VNTKIWFSILKNKLFCELLLNEKFTKPIGFNTWNTYLQKELKSDWLIRLWQNLLYLITCLVLWRLQHIHSPTQYRYVDEDFLETFFLNTLIKCFQVWFNQGFAGWIQILGLNKECFQFLKRLYDITCFGAV
jgi:hypothetical protein